MQKWAKDGPKTALNCVCSLRPCILDRYWADTGQILDTYWTDTGHIQRGFQVGNLEEVVLPKRVERGLDSPDLAGRGRGRGRGRDVQGKREGRWGGMRGRDEGEG